MFAGNVVNERRLKVSRKYTIFPLEELTVLESTYQYLHGR
jgi:hypothetical protein